MLIPLRDGNVASISPESLQRGKRARKSQMRKLCNPGGERMIHSTTMHVQDKEKRRSVEKTRVGGDKEKGGGWLGRKQWVGKVMAKARSGQRRQRKAKKINKGGVEWCMKTSKSRVGSIPTPIPSMLNVLQSCFCQHQQSCIFYDTQGCWCWNWVGEMGIPWNASSEDSIGQSPSLTRKMLVGSEQKHYLCMDCLMS